ncbi:quinoprotein dehydrogenase-associated putative ABC transporter substrate-binding protein [Sphingosinicellaceae bacterium]|nr:quinoprotein dehydrogenase-associated putative ABC transporter substrate-binding protein [Sphingosinicellaceae bacterium]
MPATWRAVLLAALGFSAATPTIAAERAEAIDRATLRVCADPSAPPSSTEDGKGYENRIAELFAKDLGVPVAYTWFPTGIGFYRRTLMARRCDVVMGTVVGIDIASTTIPYYRSTYVLVTRAADNITATTLDDPALKRLSIGAQSSSPAADVLARAGMLDTMRGYSLTFDTGAAIVGKRMIDDVAARQVDAAVVWGPIGAWFASLQPGVFRVTPLASGPKPSPLAFDIGMATRFGEARWKARIEQFITANRAPIEAILTASHVPLLPPTEAAP